MLQLFLTMATIPLEQNILRKCVLSEEFDQLCMLCICDVMRSWGTSLRWTVMEEHQR